MYSVGGECPSTPCDAKAFVDSPGGVGYGELYVRWNPEISDDIVKFSHSDDGNDRGVYCYYRNGEVFAASASSVDTYQCEQDWDVVRTANVPAVHLEVDWPGDECAGPAP